MWSYPLAREARPSDAACPHGPYAQRTSPTAADGVRLELKRDLSMYAVFTISLGAMVGSGIFVLPGLAFKLAGPSVVLAYVLAGLVVIPAVLSTSEMATAMPQAGGTYLYVDRAMGPLTGTIAGFGVWFVLIFKGGFALVGLGAYFEILVDIPRRPLALALAAALIVINIVGVKETGRLQAIVVSVVLGTLVFFVTSSVGDIDGSRYEPVFASGIVGLLSATGLVFVSYAGVTSVASIAEEVDRPARTIPRAMITSVLIMVGLYPVLVFVMIGVTGPEFVDSVTPLAMAASAVAGSGLAKTVAVVAVLALVSMANAGLLASSRYPFAMARNGLAPAWLGLINPKTGTPVRAVIVTGSVLVVLITTVPLVELAKLASAFQLLVLALVNLALIAFRESRLDWYRPPFKAPWYPWVQIFGVVGCMVLLGFMGKVPIIGAVAIVAGGFLWYRVFGQARASHESASFDALRSRASGHLIAQTEAALSSPGKHHVAIPVHTEISERRIRDLLFCAAAVTAEGGVVDVIRVDPDGPEGGPRTASSSQDETFVQRVEGAATDLAIEPEVLHVTGRHRRQAADAYLRGGYVDFVLSELVAPREDRDFNHDIEWLADRSYCDFAFLGNRYLGRLQDIVVLGSGGPVDPIKINLAARMAIDESAVIKFVHVFADQTSGRQVASLHDYHRHLDDVLAVPTRSEIVRNSDLVGTIAAHARTADLVVMGAARRRFRALAGLAGTIGLQVDVPLLMVRTPELGARPSLAGRILERFLS
jgi:amino acid transporter/nucleotide-binding universal stress UspA family protein